MGKKIDLANWLSNSHHDNPIIQQAINITRSCIYKKGVRINNQPLMSVLAPLSLRPVRVSLLCNKVWFHPLTSWLCRVLSRNTCFVMESTIMKCLYPTCSTSLNWVYGRQCLRTWCVFSTHVVELQFRYWTVSVSCSFWLDVLTNNYQVTDWYPLLGKGQYNASQRMCQVWQNWQHRTLKTCYKYVNMQMYIFVSN